MKNRGSDRSLGRAAQENFPDSERRGNLSKESSDESVDKFGRQMLSRLSQVIEGDIIPRLMLALDSPGITGKEQASADRLANSIDDFVHILLSHDASIASRYVETLRADGMPLASIYLDLLAPSARKLGEMWEDDECSFTDVTIGVCRMHQVLLEFSRCFDATQGTVESGRNALVVPVPGEQHTFGILMVVEFMRRGGWNCFTGNPANGREFRKLVRSQDFEVIGISVSADRNIDLAKDLISEIRHGDRNSDSVILAGGRAFLDQPDLVAEVGADATAVDGREAVIELQRLRQEATHLSGK